MQGPQQRDAHHRAVEHGGRRGTTEIGLDASLLPERLIEGDVAISLQSDSLGASVLELVKKLALGLSWFVSLGDRADVSGTDLLQFFEDDETTRVIGMYTEDLGDPRRFARIARRVSQRRPIVAVRTAAELGPTNSALYRHCGLIEVPTVAALLDTVRVLATQPVLRGDRIAVLSNYPSPLRLASRAIAAVGLRPVDPPIQLDFRATPADYAAAIDAALGADDVDGLMVVYAPPLAEAVGGPVERDRRRSDRCARSRSPPCCWPPPTARSRRARRCPTSCSRSPPLPCSAAPGRTGGGSPRRQHLRRSPSVDVDDDARPRAGGECAPRAGRAGSIRRRPPSCSPPTGSAYPPTRFVATADAVGAAAEIGFPVAVKARQRHVGRSVRAGVALDLTDAADVRESIDVMLAELGDDADFVVVQAMVPPGLDVRIHTTIDDEAGPLVSVGIGGIQAGLVGDDEPRRLAPLSLHSATSLVAESRAGPALVHAGIDPMVLVDTLTRAAQLAADHAEITSLDLNPVIVAAGGCYVTDAVVTAGAGGPPEGRPPPLVSASLTTATAC